jgi:hypothetical protein
VFVRHPVVIVFVRHPVVIVFVRHPVVIVFVRHPVVIVFVRHPDYGRRDYDRNISVVSNIQQNTLYHTAFDTFLHIIVSKKFVYIKTTISDGYTGNGEFIIT